MTAGSQVVLKRLQEEVKVSVNTVESGIGVIYVGTDRGNVYSYAVAAQTLTLLGNAGGGIISMVLYSGFLYIGVNGGKFISFTIA